MHGPTCIFWANPTPFSLQNDKRFPLVLAKLLKYGLQLGSCVRSKKDGTILPACAQAAVAKDPHYLATAMKFVKLETEQQYYTNRNAWNAMALEREVEFWEVAIFKHAKQYFPRVRGSDFLYTKWTSDYWCALPRMVLALIIRAFALLSL